MRLISRTTFAALLAAGTCLSAAPALAQQDPSTERTGPLAGQATPEFQDPVEFPTFEPEAPPIPRVAGTTTITSLEVSAEAGVAGEARSDFGALTDPISDLRVSASGGELLDAAWVQRQFAANGMIGSEVALDRLSAMVQLVNRAFVANGFINSGLLLDGPAPARPGPLQARLVQGRLVGEDGGILVSFGDNGRRGLSERYVASRMPSGRASPLDIIAVERDFRLLAEDPAIASVSADLRPGNLPGEAQLAMIVNPAERFDLYLGYANSRSPSIGGERFSAGASIRNLLAGGDFFSVEGGLTAGEPDANLGYSTPLGGGGTSLFGRGGFNRAAVVDPELLPLDISARDWNIEGGLTQRLFADPLTPSRSGVGWDSARSLTVGASVAHRESTTYLLGQPFSFSPGAVNGRATYTALRLTADYVERGINTVFVVSLTGTQGLDGSRSDVPGLISPDSDFRSIRGQVSYARLLSDNGLELRLRAAGQYADGILYSGERFAAGGRQTVRGYRETLVLSDIGFTGSAELAQPFSLTGSTSGFDWGAFTASAFVDGGMLGNLEIADPVSDKLLSVGASLTWRPSPAIQATLAYAHAIEDVVFPGQRDLQDRGVHFAITIRPLELLR